MKRTTFLSAAAVLITGISFAQTVEKKLLFKNASNLILKTYYHENTYYLTKLSDKREDIDTLIALDEELSQQFKITREDVSLNTFMPIDGKLHCLVPDQTEVHVLTMNSQTGALQNAHVVKVDKYMGSFYPDRITNNKLLQTNAFGNSYTTFDFSYNLIDMTNYSVINSGKVPLKHLSESLLTAGYAGANTIAVIGKKDKGLIRISVLANDAEIKKEHNIDWEEFSGHKIAPATFTFKGFSEITDDKCYIIISTTFKSKTSKQFEAVYGIFVVDANGELVLQKKTTFEELVSGVSDADPFDRGKFYPPHVSDVAISGNTLWLFAPHEYKKLQSGGNYGNRTMIVDSYYGDQYLFGLEGETFSTIAIQGLRQNDPYRVKADPEWAVEDGKAHVLSANETEKKGISSTLNLTTVDLSSGDILSSKQAEITAENELKHFHLYIENEQNVYGVIGDDETWYFYKIAF